MKKFDKTNFFFSWKPKNERIRFYAICVHLLHYNIIAAPKKFKKRPRRLNRPKANHKCHKKPNPSREPVPFNAHWLMAKNICKIWNVSLFTLQIRPASPVATTQEYLTYLYFYCTISVCLYSTVSPSSLSTSIRHLHLLHHLHLPYHLYLALYYSQH